jgi:hypothetical protein
MRMRYLVQIVVILAITLSALFIVRIINPEAVLMQGVIFIAGLLYLFWWLWRQRALQ